MTKKVVVLGGQGMLGQAIAERLNAFDLSVFSRSDLDISCADQLHTKLFQLQPDYIINCAAYTAVDLAEEEIEKAFMLNGLAVEKLAQISQQLSATLIHFSTDYVFDGKASNPYRPDDETAPINVYGASKLRGEQSMRKTNGKYYIFRISWLYAPHGKNFFKWVATTDQTDLKVVNTQTGCPTSALDVADFIGHVINQDPEAYGTYHFANKGVMTWYDFAVAINKELQLKRNISPVAEFKTAAKRPKYSVMDTKATEKTFGYTIPEVTVSLKTVADKISDGGQL
ncbi:dTDP-4-dehydrorhamnose reductase [Nonlabens xiamenensis]|uniref:dTDP-4-dehydrorhamnose reductase n=1 Tax=Nonlabens xiamenensis TaxID=2341043 RepID=UPI000F60D2C5|nr:dTDP-4-dehydrorhamnose reductase [Nonlabens xiamenensis]